MRRGGDDGALKRQVGAEFFGVMGDLNQQMEISWDFIGFEYVCMRFSWDFTGFNAVWR